MVVHLVVGQPADASSLAQPKSINDRPEAAANHLLVELQRFAVFIELLPIWGCREAESELGASVEDLREGRCTGAVAFVDDQHQRLFNGGLLR
ncbi:MAG: hypothetical protein V9E89_02225 [Ilumatobacteraceae bacterium]